MSVAIVDQDNERGNAVAAIICSLRPHGATPRITRVAEVEHPQARDVDVVLVALDSDKEKARQTIDAICRVGGVATMVYGQRPDGELLIQCMRAGVREFLHYPFEQDALQEAFSSWTGRARLTSMTRRSTGRAFAFVGAKGGCGTTMTACNFAVALAQESERRTLLIDLDLPLGDAALYLGAPNDFSVLDALRQSERLDATYLSNLAWKHESGLHVLGAPGRFVRLAPPGAAIDQLIALAARTFDYVVIDAGFRMDLAETRLFDLASTIYLVTQASVPELRNANRLITECLQNHSTKIEVVWNRYTGEEMGINDENVKDALTMPVQWKIPNDFTAVRRMQNTAEPLGKSRVQVTIKEMAIAACGKQQEKEKKGDLLRFMKNWAVPTSLLRRRVG